MTEKLFYRDSFLTEFEAAVISCTERDGKFETELDRTAFFPEGGGQYADTGLLGAARVLDVQEENGRILHITDRSLTVGETVKGILDWEERFMKMQQHTGEHIVSGLVHARFGYNNVGFHLGSEDCTMDFNGEITGQELEEIEREANRAVWKNLEVQTVFPSAQELERMEYRSKIEIEGQTRIVIIPGYDCCACCAPHVKHTGEIGLIKLTGVQRYKGGVRVTMLCGIRALQDYERKHAQIRAIGAMLCSKETGTSDAVHRLQQECADLKYALSEKEKKLTEYRARMVPEGSGPVCIFSGDIEGASMRGLMNHVLDAGHCLCAVFQGSRTDGYRYVIGSRTADVRPLAKEFNALFSGRGGGKPEMVQGTAAGAEEEMRAWLLKKAEEML